MSDPITDSLKQQEQDLRRDLVAEFAADIIRIADTFAPLVGKTTDDLIHQMKAHVDIGVRPLRALLISKLVPLDVLTKVADGEIKTGVVEVSEVSTPVVETVEPDIVPVVNPVEPDIVPVVAAAPPAEVDLVSAEIVAPPADIATPPAETETPPAETAAINITTTPPASSDPATGEVAPSNSFTEAARDAAKQHANAAPSIAIIWDTADTIFVPIEAASPETAHLLPIRDLERLQVLPLRIENDSLTVLCKERNADVATELARLLSGNKLDIANIRFVRSTVEHFHQAFDYLSAHVEMNVNPLLGQQTSGSQRDEKSKAARNYASLKNLEGGSDTPVTKAAAAIANSAILKAVHNGSSDIHIEPYPMKDGVGAYQVRMRLDGQLQIFQDEIPFEVGKGLIQRLVAGAGFVGNWDQKSHSGRYEIDLAEAGGRWDLRIEATPIAGFGTELVLRLLGQEKQDRAIDEFYVPGETDIGVKTLEVLDRMKDGGLFLLTGATGSGKSSYMNTMLRYLSNPSVKITTIEDPIEARIPGVHHCQADKENTFNSLLRGALRRDPDIIMVGEIRDEVTMEICFKAAATGHILLSTLHAKSACEVPRRLIGLGMPAEAVGDNLQAVIAQKLVPTLCSRCDENTRADCPYCDGSGEHGRTAIGEMLIVDSKVRAIIDENPNPDVLLAKSGITTMAEHAAEVIKAGRTSYDLIRRLAGSRIADMAREIVDKGDKQAENETSASVFEMTPERGSQNGVSQPETIQIVNGEESVSALTTPESA